MLYLAGMPSVDLTDMAKVRISTISFFLMVFLVSAFVIWRIWNSLQVDFPKLPRISFRTALGGTFLWSLAMMIVLTMISGARELMTPKAWEKVGWTYRVSDAEAEAMAYHPPTFDDRRRALEGLRSALTAGIVDGRYPASLDDIPASLKTQPGISPTQYGYVTETVTENEAPRGLTATGPPRRLAFEYELYDDGRQLVLMTNGEIVVENTQNELPTVVTE